MWKLALMLACSCMHVPTYEAKPRSRNARISAELVLGIDCVKEGLDESYALPWNYAHGVMIGPRKALTVWHAVDCPGVPVITAWTDDDLWYRMLINHVWHAADVVELEIATRDWLPIAPPTIVAPLRDHDEHHGFYELRTTRKADIGSPIYDREGNLVGLVTDQAIIEEHEPRRYNFDGYSDWARGVALASYPEIFNDDVSAPRARTAVSN